jgi:hypothetical protein
MNQPDTTMQINFPEVVAELEQAFDTYEQALIGNDVKTLDRSFWYARRPYATALPKAVSVAFSAPDKERTGRHMQAWARFAEGGPVVAAHVSLR